MDEIWKDPRFSHIPKDPKFRRIPKSERKVKIDKRFQSMFNDKKFTVKYTIDKRGRPINQTSTENLKKYYDLSSNSEDENDSDDEKNKNVKRKSLKNNKAKILINKEQLKIKDKEKNNVHDHQGSDQSDDDGVSDADVSEASINSNISNLDLEENDKQLQLRSQNDTKTIDIDTKKKLKDLTIDYARGEGALFTDSSSDEVSSEEDEVDEEIEHNWGELDKEADSTDEVTSRLAVCNMDWDRIRAVDIMVLLNSFLPPGGLIHSVTIYPSDYGLQRMKEEDMKGPIELVDANLDKKFEEENPDDQNEEGSSYHMEKMRQYQLNRLKYYYAVVTFDSNESANKIYTECDGIEYESTAIKLDLRFIPDDMEFNQEPKDICNKLPEVLKYQPRQFTTSALQQVKVELTWDETKPERKEITQKIISGKLNEIDDADIQAYLASGTSDDSDVDGDDDNTHNVEEIEKQKSKDDDELDPIDKYKSLLKSIEEKEEEKKNKEVELEFTWGLSAKEKTEKLVKERMKKADNLTPFEQYLEKRKEKKKTKREMRKNKQLNDGDSSDNEGTDSDDSVPSDVDMNDPYFAEEMKNMTQKRKGKKKIDKKQKKQVNRVHDDDDDEKQKKSELELLMLDRDDGKHHFDMKKIEESELLSKSKKKRLNKKKKALKEVAVEDDFEVNVNDPRFSAVFDSHHFNIDPADPHYRRTKGTETLVKEKLKRRANGDDKKEVIAVKQIKNGEKLSADLAALVKTVKKNTKNISKPIK